MGRAERQRRQGCLYEAGFRGGRACAVRSVALPFRRMITVNGLQEELLAIAQRPLEQAGKMVSGGTAANAAIVENSHA